MHIHPKSFFLSLFFTPFLSNQHLFSNRLGTSVPLIDDVFPDCIIKTGILRVEIFFDHRKTHSREKKGLLFDVVIRFCRCFIPMFPLITLWLLKCSNLDIGL